MPTSTDFQSAVTAIGERILDRMDAIPEPALLSKEGLYGRLMEWSLRDPAFKTQLFRFVDVLPMLEDSSDLVRHLREYLGDRAVELSPALRGGLAMAGMAPGIVAGPVRSNVEAMARLFVAGENPEQLVEHVRARAHLGMAVTVDLLGETVLSEAEADIFLARNLEILDKVSAALADGRTGGPCASDRTPEGVLPRLNLSVKISALTPELHPADPEGSLELLKPRLRLLLRRAAAVGAFVNFDMESTRFHSLTLDLFTQLLSEEEFRRVPACGIALQAYLRESERDLQNLISWARRDRRPITVRLVKGAYWDQEVILARQRSWPVPVWQSKHETDAHYERLSRILLESLPLVTPAFATHNVRSCAHAIAAARQLGVRDGVYEFQALYGMAEPLKHALLAEGHRVREYSPVGALLPGMAYFVRRLLENTSNEGFIQALRSGRVARSRLLANPAAQPSPPSRTEAARDFFNAPNTDFTRTDARMRMRKAIEGLPLGHDLPAWFHGKPRKGKAWLETRDPCDPSRLVARCAVASIDQANEAVQAARLAQPAWAGKTVAERAARLERAADLLEARRFELAALAVREVAKPWIEADAEVSEAIDFCRYYALQARLLDGGRRAQETPGEANHVDWIPRGVGVAIAPWNFPIAIACGMVVSALVGGNAVILKPAEQAGACAAALFSILQEAGLDGDYLQLVPGIGEEVGAHLAAHPDVDFLVFTGSREVGLRIWESAARASALGRGPRKVVCEMGGKNAMIVDVGADPDEAIPAVLHSAFGYAGQKCSALSRLILLDRGHGKFLKRLLEAAESVRCGPALAPGTIVPAVIDATAKARLDGILGRARAEATVAFEGRVPGGEGHFVPPVILTDVAPDSWLTREEFFGPILTVQVARDLDEAFRWANGTDYALTGGVFSRSPSTLERARREFRAGNLYLNRAITGAMVERHPFGGYGMSGGGTKAGGPDMVREFLIPRAVSENCLRRGFAPE